MSAVTYRCDQCGATTDESDPFKIVPSVRGGGRDARHWLAIDGKHFCRPGCATKHWADPIKNHLDAAQERLNKACAQLDHCPDAFVGDMLGVQLSSVVSYDVAEAIRILGMVLRLTGRDRFETGVLLVSSNRQTWHRADSDEGKRVLEGGVGYQMYVPRSWAGDP